MMQRRGGVLMKKPGVHEIFFISLIILILSYAWSITRMPNEFRGGVYNRIEQYRANVYDLSDGVDGLGAQVHKLRDVVYCLSVKDAGLDRAHTDCWASVYTPEIIHKKSINAL